MHSPLVLFHYCFSLPQVRELAAACISGFVRCGFFSCLDKLKVPNYYISAYVCLVCMFDVCVVPLSVLLCVFIMSVPSISAIPVCVLIKVCVGKSL